MSKNAVSIGGSVAAVAVGVVVAIVASDNGREWAGLPAIVWCAIAAFAINWIASVPAIVGQTERFYDLVGSITYFTVTAFALVMSGADRPVSWLLAVLIWIWCTRLGSFLVARIRRDGHDGRFDTVKVDPLRFFMFWTIQGLWVFLTAVAAYVAITADDDGAIGPLVVVGLVVWVIGFAIEVVADNQKSAFKRDPANQGRFISTGLWAWSRHPNYFGEITLWVGVAIIALPSLDGGRYIALISPVFVYLLLTRISGTPLLERRANKRWGGQPDYDRYVANTPVLFPRPPRGA